MGKCFACGQKISSFERLEGDSPLVAKIEAIRSASLMMSWQQVDYAITAALKDARYVDGVLSDYRDMKFRELERDETIARLKNDLALQTAPLTDEQILRLRNIRGWPMCDESFYRHMDQHIREARNGG